MPYPISALALSILLLLSGCTPLRQPLGEFEQPALLLPDRALMADGYELPLSAWRPQTAPVAVVLALHGFNDYRTAFRGVGDYLASQGILTYAADQRGFGETAHRGLWPGDAPLAADAQSLLQLIRSAHPGLPVYLLGVSMGGAVAIRASTAGPPLADGVILVAPAVWSRLTMPWYQRLALELAVRIAPGWRPTGESLGFLPSDNLPMLQALFEDPLVIKKTRIDTTYGLVDLMDTALAAAPALPVKGLVLYGERDQLIPRQPTCRLLDSLPASGWRFGLYPQGYHMLLRDLQAERVWRDVAHWIKDEPGPLPSGQERARPAWNEFCSAG